VSAKLDDSAVELRILSGLHQGARETLDEQSIVVGAGADCDFILQDPGILPLQLRLTRRAGDWFVARALEDGEGGWGTEKLVALDEPLGCGSILLCVSEPDTDWPSLEQMLPFMATPEHDQAENTEKDSSDELDQSPALPDMPSSEIDDPDGKDSAPGDGEFDAPAMQTPTGFWTAGRKLAVSALLFVVAVSSLGWALSPDEPTTLVDLTAPPSTNISAQRHQAVQAIIDRLGMSDALEVVSRADATVLVNGEFLDDQRFERLALALSRLTPRPALQIGSETQWLSKLRALVSEASADLKNPLNVISVGGGNYRLEGKVLDRAHESSLLASLDKVLPAQMQIESALVFIEDDAMNMLRRLQAARLGEISGVWKAGQLHLDVRLMRKEVQQWERLITRVAPTYDVPFVANLEVLSGRQTVRAETRLPFNLQAIVGGAAPYVVIGSDRLFVDGTRDGWKLVLIDDLVAVFESSPEQRVTVRR
jgi:type III secretion protein D